MKKLASRVLPKLMMVVGASLPFLIYITKVNACGVFSYQPEVPKSLIR